MDGLISTIEYEGLRRMQGTHIAWAELKWRHKNGWIVIPADEVGPAEIDNNDRSLMEQYEWHHNPPDRYFAYVDENTSKLIDFTGAPLGNVTFGRRWVSCFGDARAPIRVQGTNGVEYYGTYFVSAGTYARIRRTGIRRKA